MKDRRKHHRYWLAVGVLGVMLGVEPVQAYEEAPVPDGGTLVGSVTLVGKVPRPKGYNLTTLPDPVYCGRISDGKGWRLLQPFKVGEHGEFRQVVVLIEGVNRGKPFGEAQSPKIKAMDCRFLPFVNVVRNHHDIVVVNNDPAMHDIQAYETSESGPRVLFNVPLPISPRYPHQAALSAHYFKHFDGPPMTQPVAMTKGRHTVVLQCGFHAYMESWALVVDHPYVAITDGDGRFAIGDIPPGTYQVRVWHPYVHDTQSFTVTIEPKGRTVLDAKITAPKGRLYANEMMEDPYIRYEVTKETQSQIVPTLEKQRY